MNSDHSITRINGIDGLPTRGSPIVTNGLKGDSPAGSKHGLVPSSAAAPGYGLYPPVGHQAARIPQAGPSHQSASADLLARSSYGALAAAHHLSQPDPRTLAMFPHMMGPSPLRPPGPFDYPAIDPFRDPYRLDMLGRDPLREARERELMRLNPLGSLVNSELERAKALGLAGYPSLPAGYPSGAASAYAAPTTLAALNAHKMVGSPYSSLYSGGAAGLSLPSLGGLPPSLGHMGLNGAMPGAGAGQQYSKDQLRR